MNYEKKHKEALERATKELQACGSTDCDAYRLITRLFPELKESEDERIRKELIEEVRDQIAGIPSPDCRDKEDEKALKQLNKWLAWLEKQKLYHPVPQREATGVLKMLLDEEKKPIEEYNPYKATVEGILAMFQKDYTDAQDFIDNIKVKCQDAIEYETGVRPKVNEQKSQENTLPSIVDRETLDEFAYQYAYDLSNDWMKDNPTWKDVETACKLGAQWVEQKKPGYLKSLKQRIAK